MLNLLLLLVVLGFAIAPFVAIVETAGWVIRQHSFPDATRWIAAALGIGFWIFVRSAKQRAINLLVATQEAR